MIKSKNIYFLLTIIIFLHSCNTLSDAGKVFRNEKIKTTDEFLVKKREPLVLPPDYNEIPTPNSIENKKKIDEEKTIEEILKVKKDKGNSNPTSSSIEESVLNKIRK